MPQRFHHQNQLVQNFASCFDVKLDIELDVSILNKVLKFPTEILPHLTDCIPIILGGRHAADNLAHVALNCADVVSLFCDFAQ